MHIYLIKLLLLNLCPHCKSIVHVDEQWHVYNYSQILDFDATLIVNNTSRVASLNNADKARVFMSVQNIELLLRSYFREKQKWTECMNN